MNKTCVRSKDNLNSVGDMPMLPVMLKDDSANINRQKKWIEKPTLQQNQKSCSPAHKPTQLQLIWFCPIA